MKYEHQVYKQFPGKINDSETYENLSAYLMSNGVRNDVNLKGRGRNWCVIAHFPKNDLVMKVSFNEISPMFRKPKTEMFGEISTGKDNKESQELAIKLEQVLSGYIPSTPKEDEE